MTYTYDYIPATLKPGEAPLPLPLPAQPPGRRRDCQPMLIIHNGAAGYNSHYDATVPFQHLPPGAGPLPPPVVSDRPLPITPLRPVVPPGFLALPPGAPSKPAPVAKPRPPPAAPPPDVPQYVLDAVRDAGLAAATAFVYPTTAEQARAISSASHRVLIDHGYPDALIPCIFCAKRSKKMHGADLHVTLRTECTINLTELSVVATMQGKPKAPPNKPPPRRPPTSTNLRHAQPIQPPTNAMLPPPPPPRPPPGPPPAACMMPPPLPPPPPPPPYRPPPGPPPGPPPSGLPPPPQPPEVYFNSGLHPCSPGSHPPAHWAWAASLDSATLPDLPHIACVNRIPRSLLIDVTEALAPILRALRKDRTNVAANNMLWLFPRLVLRKDAVKSDNAQGRRMSSRVRERYNAYKAALPPGDRMSTRVRRFCNGDWQGLLEDYKAVAALKVSLDGSRNKTNRDPQLDAYMAADRLAAVGEASRAVQRLTNECTPVPNVSVAVAMLLPMHGDEGGLSEAEADTIVAAVSTSRALELTEESVRWALGKAPRGAAPGPSGWMLEYWKDLMLEDSFTLEHVTIFINNAFCSGVLPAPLRQLWGACCTVALAKPKGGYRPISMGETLRRITGKAAIHQLSDPIREQLEPLQWGVGSSRGCVTIIHTLRDYLSLHPDHVLLKSDVRNAFNCQSRSAFLRSIETDLPSLLPLAAQFYLAPTQLLIRGSGGALGSLQSISGQQQGDTLGTLLFSFGLQPILRELQERFPLVLVRAYADDVHLLGADSDVAAAFELMQERMAAINLTVSYGPEKTEAWSPAWANLGAGEDIASALPTAVERCRGGMKVLGSYVGTDAYTKQRAMESVTDKKDRAFAHVCEALTLFAQAGLEHSKNVANMLLNKCVVTKLDYLLETLPPHISADAAAERDRLIKAAFIAINNLTEEQWDLAQARIELPTSLKGCGLRSAKDIAAAAYITARMHTSAAVISALTRRDPAASQEDAATQAPAVAGMLSPADDAFARDTALSWLAAKRNGGAAPAVDTHTTQPPASADGAGAQLPNPATTPVMGGDCDAPIYQTQPRQAADPSDASSPPLHAAVLARTAPLPVDHVIADITAATAFLPAVARDLVDTETIGSDKPDKHLRRKLVHKIEKERFEEHWAALEQNGRSTRDRAHLNSCSGAWLLVPALRHMRLTNAEFSVRLLRYLNLRIPACMNIPMSADGKPADDYGDFTLSVYTGKGAEWWVLHEQLKEFFYRCAKRARLGDVGLEGRGDTSKSDERPGDVRIGSTHGWRAATGKELLLDVTTADAVCKTYVELCAAREGAAAAEKVKEKRNKYKHTLRPEQYLQTLAFESEGYTSPEAQQLLLVWAQMWAEKRNESPAAAKRLYYAWSCELAHLHAKYLARCIMARARRSSEVADNKAKTRADVRAPTASYADQFFPR
jgi:hypothetical protein